jgi:tetratricopeptide (TPR) repeat protein
MKILKILFVTVFSVVLSFGYLKAQDINEAINLYNNGIAAFQASHYEKAIADIEKALNIAQAVEDEQATALKENCEKIIPQLYYRMGQQNTIDKNYSAALVALIKAKALAGQYNDEETKNSVDEFLPQAYTAMGNDEVAAEKFTEGIANYKKALEYTSDNSTLYLRLGLAQVKAKDEAGAITSFEQAIKTGEASGKDSDVTNAKKQVGTIYLKRAAAAQPTKKWAQVYENAQKAIEYDGNNVQSQKLLGASAVELKKWDEAITAYEAVQAANPNAKDKSTTQYRLAVAYEGIGNKAKACEYYKMISGEANFKAIAEHKIKNELKCQ